MANEDALHRCVSKFMFETCRDKTSEYAPLTLLSRSVSEIASSGPRNCKVFSSCSSAEFRIIPMLSCVGDIDVMYAPCNVLAIPYGHSPPTELPSNYQQIVRVHEIIDSDRPGYVYLKATYRLTKNDNGSYVADNMQTSKNDATFVTRFNYNYNQTTEKHFLQNPFLSQEIISNVSLQSLLTPVKVPHGPATIITISENTEQVYNDTFRHGAQLSFDLVPCMRCLTWPPHAAGWPTRQRDHGWPDMQTISTVVDNGCDVVAAVHPACRQDEWMNKHQCRLSFSRAEVTLLNSWMPVQQIIYHMMRFVIKHGVLSKINDNDRDFPTLCNYHIKTLMLWECEEKPPSWWSAESSLIKICSSLLHTLCDWVANKHCQHYFISNCNLIDHFQDASLTICSNLRYLTDLPVLLSWFIENYISKCVRYCPAEVSILFEDIPFNDKLFEDVISSDKLQSAVHAFVDWKLSTVNKELYEDQSKAEAMTLSFVLTGRRDARCIQILMEQLKNFDLRLADYFTAVITLGIASTILTHSLTDDVLEVLWTIFDPSHAATDDSPIATKQHVCGALLSIRRAVTLATSSSLSSHSLQMLNIEISKLYLHHSFTHELASTYCVVHVLLAALYYKSGHYQTAITHCKQVLRLCECEQYVLQKIGTQYLPQIDETVDSVCGLILLYEHVQRTTLNPSAQVEHETELAFTVRLLANYLYSKCSPVAEVLSMYEHHLTETEEPLLSDILLFKATKMQLDECTEMSFVSIETENANDTSCSMDTTLLETTLELEALKNLTNVRHMMIRELHSDQFPLLNEFNALYAYKCGLFEECLEMCRNHVNVLLRAGARPNQLYMVVLPELHLMLDGELVSLFGFIKLMHPVLFLFLLQFPYCESISMLTLCLYLMVQCQKKLRSDSLCDTLQLIRVVHDKVFPADNNECYLDRLILKLTYRSLKLYIHDSVFPCKRFVDCR